jgi:hypothetical protein
MTDSQEEVGPDLALVKVEYSAPQEIDFELYRTELDPNLYVSYEKGVEILGYAERKAQKECKAEALDERAHWMSANRVCREIQSQVDETIALRQLEVEADQPLHCIAEALRRRPASPLMEWKHFQKGARVWVWTKTWTKAPRPIVGGRITACWTGPWWVKRSPARHWREVVPMRVMGPGVTPQVVRIADLKRY